MAKRTVNFAVSGAESPWREVGKVISRAVSSDDYEFDLQSHPDLANPRAVGNGTCELGVTMATYYDWAAVHIAGLETETSSSRADFSVVSAWR